MNAQDLLFPALKELAARFDLPELLEDFTPDTSVQATEVRPRGQMALLVHSAKVTVRTYAQSEHGPAAVKVDFSYKHHDGGSNGKDIVFLAVIEDGKFRGLIENNLYVSLRRRD